MLTASAATKTILNQSPQILCADLYSFVLPDSTVLRWSGGDQDFTVASGTYTRGPLITRGAITRKVGIDVDDITVNIADNGVMLNGRPLVRCIQEGELDGALVTIERLFLSSWADLTPGSVQWFFGYVSDVDGDQGVMRLKVKDLVGYLDVPMPKALYMPPCNNTFGDAACTKSIPALTDSGTVGAGSTNKSINLSGAGVTKADGYYTLGVLKCGSGPNAGLTRTIRLHASNVATISPALPVAPGTGDSLTGYPSCFKLQTSCVGYGNLPNFRGFPWVPSPETMYSGGSNPPAGGSQGGTGSSPGGSTGGGRTNQSSYRQ